MEVKLRAILPLHDGGKGSGTDENRLPLGGPVMAPEKDFGDRLWPHTMGVSESGNGIEHHRAYASAPNSSDQMGRIGWRIHRE